MLAGAGLLGWLARGWAPHLSFWPAAQGDAVAVVVVRDTVYDRTPRVVASATPQVRYVVLPRDTVYVGGMGELPPAYTTTTATTITATVTGTGTTTGTTGGIAVADTAAVVADYLLTRRYEDTLVNDSSGLIALRETVRHNRLYDRELTFVNRRATYVYSATTTTAATTTTPTDAAGAGLRVYCGGFAGKGLAAPVVGVGRKRWRVGVGYNLAGGGGVVASFSWEIRTKN